MAYKTWTFDTYIGSTNTNEDHIDYINVGSIVGTEDYILSGQKGTIDLLLHVSGTQNQANWKACTTVEIVLMSAPACYPRLSKYQQKRVVSEKITTRAESGGGSCTLTAENAFVLHAGNNLYIGAVGFDSTGAVVRTTNMQYACTIEQGADVEELTDGANMSLTAAETLRQQIAGKMNATGYTDAVGEIPVVTAAGNLKVRPVEFAIDNNDNFVLRGTEKQVIATIPKSQLGGDSSQDIETIQQDVNKLMEDLGDTLSPEYSITSNAYIDWQNGIQYTLDGIMCTDYIPVKVGDAVNVTGVYRKVPDSLGSVVYDDKKRYLNGVQNAKNDVVLNIAQDGFVRLSFTDKQKFAVSIFRPHSVSHAEYNAEIADIKQKLNDSVYGYEEILDNEQNPKVDGVAGKIKPDGTNDGVTYHYHFNLEIPEEKNIITLKYNGGGVSSAVTPLLVFKNNDNVVGYINYTNEAIGAEYTYSIPTNATEVFVNANTKKAWQILVKFGQKRKVIPFDRLSTDIISFIGNRAVKENPLEKLLENGGYTSSFASISCVGDSLTEGVSEYIVDGKTKYAGRNEGLETFSYPAQLARMTGSIVRNYGVGGATAKSWLETNKSKDCFSPENKSQAYIIAIGTNDTVYDGDVDTDVDISDYNNNSDNFVGNYAKIIQKCLESQPKAKVFAVTIPKTRSNYHNAWTDGNSRIKAVAKKLGVYVLDIYSFSDSFRDADAYKMSFYSGGHRNAVGYKRTAMEYATYISWLIEKNPSDFKNIQFIGTNMWYS